MKKRKKQEAAYTIPVQGGSVPVTKTLYKVWKHYENKENYFMVGQKEEQFRYKPEKGIAAFLPSREDSLDRLQREGVEFAEDQSSVEDRAIAAIMIKGLMARLPAKEREILYLRYYLGLSIDDSAQAFGVSSTTFRRNLSTLVKKCQYLLQDEYDSAQ